MSVSVKIPTPLRSLTKGKAEISVEAATVAEALQEVGAEFEGFSDKVFDQDGQLRRFINIYVNKDNIKDRDDLATQIKVGDTISILPSIAGGWE